MSERPSANYNCTQLELYSVLRIGLSSYRENLPAFTGFKSFYDEAWGNDFEAEINEAAELPDFQTRDEASETALILLSNKAKECTNKWQDLKRYIASTTGWEELQKPKLEAAGSTLYQKAASGSWEVLKGLMITASNFITNNFEALKADDNMPNAFKNQFNNLKDEYCDLYDDFTDKTQDQEQETDEKIAKNNAIYNKGSDMFADGQAIFRDDASMAARFTFSSILKIVRGSKGKTKTIEVAPSSFRFVDRVVKNSLIVNSGQVTLWVAEGNLTSLPATAVQLNPGAAINVPNNAKEITIFNNDEETTGQCTVRVTVD